MLIGEKIRLRAVEREDLPRFVAWLNDPEVRQGLNLYQPMSLVFEENWFEKMIKLPVEEQPLVIEIETPGGWTAIGTLGLMDRELERPLGRSRHFYRREAVLEPGLRSHGHGTAARPRFSNDQSAPHFSASV
jgi:RimJ/RimL family protein N-acetyltransferase